ncbi:hypothetical protein ACVW0P_002802 [Mucilaginibacter sp. UYNi724]
MKAQLQKILKRTSVMMFLLLTIVSSCKKETTIKPTPITPVNVTPKAEGKIDGKDFAIKENGIKSTLYTTSGDGVKSLETSATLDTDGNKLTFFLDDLKNGSIALTKKVGTSLNPGTKTIKLNAGTSQTYVQYYNSGNAYYALSGSITVTITDTYITVKWDIKFKTADGREFNSAGDFTITFASVITKPKSEVKDPTPVADKPTIENIAPAKGRVGDTISITGVNYSTTPADDIVQFNGTKAEVISATATKLMVKAPVAGTTGAVTVKVKNSEVANGPTFTYIQAATLASFSPTSGKVGDTITITGTNYSTTLTDNVVKFSGPTGLLVGANVIAATATQIKAVVPQSATTGKLNLTVNKGAALTSAGIFTVTVPQNNSDWTPIDFGSPLQTTVLSASSGNSFMFSGADGANFLYYTADGATYTNVYQKLPLSFSGLSIHLIKADGGTYYVTTSKGVAKTTDGINWTKLVPDASSPDRSFTGISAKNNVVSLLSGGELFRSQNAGSSWTKTNAPTGSGLEYISSDYNGKYFYAIKTSNNTHGATDPKKLYRSTDQGKTWLAASATTGLYFLDYGSQNFFEITGSSIFCLFSPETTRSQITDQRLYKSTNQGESWTLVSNEFNFLVKTFGDYVVYSNMNSLHVSNDVGATFKDYAIPSGYKIAGVERANGNIYIMVYTGQLGSYRYRIFKRKL